MQTFFTQNEDGKRWLDSERDKHLNKGLDTWKANNLQKEIDKKIQLESHPMRKWSDYRQNAVYGFLLSNIGKDRSQKKLLADPEALILFFGQGFKSKSLPVVISRKCKIFYCRNYLEIYLFYL